MMSEHQRLKELDFRELRRSNDILRQASAYFPQAELDHHWKNNVASGKSEQFKQDWFIQSTEHTLRPVHPGCTRAPDSDLWRTSFDFSHPDFVCP